MPRTAQSRALIVHPRFVHANPPAAAAPLPGADWHSLPFELLEAIAGHLDKAQDLLALSSVCRDARPLAAHPTLWRQLCRRRFGVPPPEDLGLEDPAAREPSFWLDLFIYNHRCFMHMVRSTQQPTDARFGAGFGAGAPLIIQLQ